jgi:hypothetical protein
LERVPPAPVHMIAEKAGAENPLLSYTGSQ